MQYCRRYLVVAIRGPAPPRSTLWPQDQLRALARRQLSSSSSQGRPPTSAVRRALRACVICTGLGLTTFAAGRISLYERLKYNYSQGRGANSWLFNSRQWTPGDWSHYPLHIAALIGINVAVFLLWRIPAAHSVLNRVAVLWPTRLGPVSLVGSMFSHQGWLHLLLNMMVLHSFAPMLTAKLGSPEEFLCLYACSGLCSGLLHTVLVPVMPCIGASGCLLGVFAYTALTNPDTPVGLVLISDLVPSLYTSAYNAFLAFVAFDILGLLGIFNLGLAHAGHLGGSAFGSAYAYGLRHWLWHKWGDLAVGCWLRVKKAVRR